MSKKESGITLVALVVTIIILIILAMISINIVLNENGMINQAEKVKEYQANAEAQDYERMQIMDNHIKEYIEKKENEGNTNTDGYVDNQLITSPKLTEGMIPVKWNGTAWIKTTTTDDQWYNYEEKKWANVVLSDSTFNGEVLDESKPYTALVWIPRYAYKITSGWHTNVAGTIDIVFVGTDNKGKDGVIYNGTYQEAVEEIAPGESMKGYVVNPAFDYGDKKLEGFWIGKFKSSHTGCTIDDRYTGQAEFTGNEIMQNKANVTCWRNITIGDAFTTCLNMNKQNNIYGLSTNDNVVDPHLTKNTEWGACSYLSKSKYGKETEEVFINNSKYYITGNAASTVSAASGPAVENAYHTQGGVKASTTGNIYGVYDMSGGAWEYVAAYLRNENENLKQYAKSLLNSNERYKNIYEVGTSDTKKLNYEAAATKYGDAMYETSNSYAFSNGSWYNDYASFLEESAVVIYRSGIPSSKLTAGVFFFDSITGGANLTDTSFRMTIPVI